eukprot:TRINITY_DN23832_c0_g1_i1.p1 TRINITY_DN23832_c0_g1~~TRINITY_DN23832_c0_g1_i1.p1  ORF type:complete len:350 (+),score=52.99 TRINITY_DN23832_c0_g1_i1:51-1100(+)
MTSASSAVDVAHCPERCPENSDAGASVPVFSGAEIADGRARESPDSSVERRSWQQRPSGADEDPGREFRSEDAAASSSSWEPMAAGSSQYRFVLQPQERHQYAFERVFLRVYDLSDNILIRGFGLTNSYGAFHSGVEVYGQEWAFGLSDDMLSGISCCAPGDNPDFSFRETIALGFTRLSHLQVLLVINDMKDEWLGCTYNALSRNCNHFAEELCLRLGVARPPAWVNSLAGVGLSASSALEAAYDGVADVTSSAYNGTVSLASATVRGLFCCVTTQTRKGRSDDEDVLANKPIGPCGRGAADGVPAVSVVRVSNSYSPLRLAARNGILSFFLGIFGRGTMDAAGSTKL